MSDTTNGCRGCDAFTRNSGWCDYWGKPANEIHFDKQRCFVPMNGNNGDTVPGDELLEDPHRTVVPAPAHIPSPAYAPAQAPRRPPTPTPAHMQAPAHPHPHAYAREEMAYPNEPRRLPDDIFGPDPSKVPLGGYAPGQAPTPSSSAREYGRPPLDAPRRRRFSIAFVLNAITWIFLAVVTTISIGAVIGTQVATQVVITDNDIPLALAGFLIIGLVVSLINAVRIIREARQRVE